ncbi:MAG: response regulator [Rhodospirillales bacterium]|nr:response regulator [Rhodospirillales bacterium]
MSTNKADTVLVVDDAEPNRLFLEAHLKAAGYQVLEATDGDEAISVLVDYQDAVDVVLLDRRMPRVDGMDVLAWIKKQAPLKSLPVIFQTAADSEKEIVEGIDAGAYYYLTKPYEPGLVLSITRAAVEDYNHHRALQKEVSSRAETLALMTEGRFLIQTLGQANDLAVTLANRMPDPDSRVLGISELLINAIEHGNLGISYEEKTRLIANGRLVKEINRRAVNPQNTGKYVTVYWQCDREKISITITDEGQGFDWKSYLDIDPDRVFDSHGRGIAIARRMSFDTLEFSGKGNVVTGTVLLSPAR